MLKRILFKHCLDHVGTLSCKWKIFIFAVISTHHDMSLRGQIRWYKPSRNVDRAPIIWDAPSCRIVESPSKDLVTASIFFDREMRAHAFSYTHGALRLIRNVAGRYKFLPL